MRSAGVSSSPELLCDGAHQAHCGTHAWGFNPCNISNVADIRWVSRLRY
jgi:hypothetical protein